ncbi:MAG: Vitamin B12 dependent methionine synthase activation subunit [Clostridiales bacterium]|nr:Vitamin B12 dependent methionine synthase activation subunit [Clostridiales bacterium]
MNKTEILHYLRTNSKVQDKALLNMIDEAMAEVNECVNPKSIYRIFDCTVDDRALTIENMRFESVRLAENLRGCTKVAVLAATAGTEGDRLLRKYAAESARLVVMQAVLSSKVEEICDAVQHEIESTLGVKTRQRYSPGYFDLDITQQKKLFLLLDITKRCSITLTDSCQMIPTKSVTAFTGIDYGN